MDNNSFSKSDSPIPSTVHSIPDQEMNVDPNFHEIKPHLKQSGPGIASFVISLVSLLGYLVSFMIAATMATSILNEFGEMSSDSSQAFMFLGVAVLALAALNVIGVVLGIIGISLRNRRKVFGVIGTIINGIILLVFMLLIATILVNIGAQ